MAIDSRTGGGRGTERGSSLLVTLVVILGLTALAAAAINMATSGTISAAHKAHADALTACANAAAQRVLAEFALAGAGPVSIQAAGIPGGPTLSPTHYDGAVIVNQVNRLSNAAGGSGVRDLDTTNTIRMGSSGGVPYGLVATCTDAQGRQFEVELFVRLGLL